jgi:hypothetical protein
MPTLTLNERIRGALTGAVIGAELSFGRIANPQAYPAFKQLGDLFSATLAPALEWQPEKNNQMIASVTPLIDLGVRTYLAARGRATPEDFAGCSRMTPGLPRLLLLSTACIPPRSCSKKACTRA